MVNNFDEQIKEINQIKSYEDKISKALLFAKNCQKEEKLEEAKKLVLEVVSYAKELKDEKFISLVYYELGSICKKMRECDKAIIYLEEAKKRTILDCDNMHINFKIANCWHKLKTFDKALFFYKESIKNAEKIDEKYWQAIAHKSLGELFKEFKYYNKAYMEYIEAKNFFKTEKKYNNLLIECMFEELEYYIFVNNYIKAKKTMYLLLDSLDYSIDYENMFYLYIKGMKIALETLEFDILEHWNIAIDFIVRKVKNKKLLSQYYELCAQIAYNNKDYQKAVELYNKYMEIDEELFKLELESEGNNIEKKNKINLSQYNQELFSNKYIELEKIANNKEKAIQELRNTQQKTIEVEKQNATLAISISANHELNQPLMIIRGCVDIIDSKIKERDENVINNINIINQTIESIKSLLNELKSLILNTIKDDNN